MKQLIFLADIDLKQSPRVREAISKETVLEYAENYRKKVPMPAPHLFGAKDSKFWLVADGLHRIAAMQTIGRKAMECETHTGGYQDALKHALLSNTTRGLRRTTADKHRCVESALMEWPKCSDGQLAAMCGVDPKTVAAIRSEMESHKTIEPTQERKGADGKTYKTGQNRKTRSGNSRPDKTDRDKESSLVDSTGYPIPSGIRGLWDRQSEVAEVLKMVSTVKCGLEKKLESDDLLWREPFLNKAIAELESVYANLSTAIPYAVCAICQGHPETQPEHNCRGCKGTGFMSKFKWERVGDKIKSIRAGVK